MRKTGKGRGLVTISAEDCKGCGLCIEVCPPQVLHFSAALNAMGYHPVEYQGDDCTGCGVCFYVCPEPGTITVYKHRDAKAPVANF
jgi:NAD-dependent dihydropyrimidine dehydrogenase PreA subunit